MKKDDMVYIGHMLDKAYTVIHNVKGKDYQEFYNDEFFRISITFWLQIIGEAARLVSEATRQAYPNIPWSDIVGMRHRIVHDYLNINFKIVWTVATDELPELVKELEKIVPIEERDAD
ncbi:MAG: DUF86 domain-containing protein [Candidatus Hatepunaea meridiana]|nr:DUF86 domain-containing protein [Candidatus Hatepunaea meridiana]